MTPLDIATAVLIGIALYAVLTVFLIWYAIFIADKPRETSRDTNPSEIRELT